MFAHYRMSSGGENILARHHPQSPRHNESLRSPPRHTAWMPIISKVESERGGEMARMSGGMVGRVDWTLHTSYTRRSGTPLSSHHSPHSRQCCLIFCYKLTMGWVTLLCSEFSEPRGRKGGNVEPCSGANSELMHNLEFVPNNANYYFSVICLTDWRVLRRRDLPILIGISNTIISIRPQG